MASPEVLDFAKLLAPIVGDNPAGRALREDSDHTSSYYRIKDARSVARAAERNRLYGADESASETEADWRPVLKEALLILAEQSKDLEITVWMIEALLRVHGFAGLRDGFRLARELVEQFWDQLYPMPDEDGVTTRVAGLSALNGVESDGLLLDPIQSAPLTAGSTGRPMSLGDYKQALEVDRVDDPDKRAQRLAQGAVAMDVFNQEVRSTPVAFYRDLVDDLTQASDEFARLGTLLEEKCGKDETGYPLAPPTSNIRNALSGVLDVVKQVAGPMLAAADASGESAEAGGALVSADGDGVAITKVRTREAAFNALLQAADFFKRTEPHSPVSYLLEQAVRWGKMPLPDLLTELIPDDSTRGNLFKLIGIRPKEGS